MLETQNELERCICIEPVHDCLAIIGWTDEFYTQVCLASIIKAFPLAELCAAGQIAENDQLTFRMTHVASRDGFSGWPNTLIQDMPRLSPSLSLAHPSAAWILASNKNIYNCRVSLLRRLRRRLCTEERVYVTPKLT